MTPDAVGLPIYQTCWAARPDSLSKSRRCVDVLCRPCFRDIIFCLALPVDGQCSEEVCAKPP